MPMVPLDGREVHYEVGGSGPTLVLVNGLVASAFLWPAPWLEVLEARFRVVRVSNRGTGHTPLGEDLTVEAMAGDVAAVLDSLEAPRAHVLGFSMGGMVAQALTIAAPDRVQALVLMSTSTGGAGDVHPEFVAAVAGSGGDTAGAAGAFFHLLTGPGFFDSHPEVLADLAVGWQAAPTPPETAVFQMAAAAGFDSRPHLPSLATPTLVLHGTEDRLLVPAGGARIAAGVPGARHHVYDGIGHMLAYETGPETAQLVAEFLDDAAA